MKRKSSILFLLALCSILTLSGCREKIEETESETQTETVSETESETETEAPKKTEKTTEKKTSASAKKTTPKKTVKPSAINGGSSSTKQSESSKTTDTNNTDNTTTATEQCPYCFQQISLAPTDSGSTIYAEHVAQEKAWADNFGWGDTPPTEDPNAGTTTPSTDAPTPPQTDTPATEPPSTGDDSAQCGYCYQWFSVSDGTYAAHIAQHNADLGLPSDTEYVRCPVCGFSYPKGNMYDNHVCISE